MYLCPYKYVCVYVCVFNDVMPEVSRELSSRNSAGWSPSLTAVVDLNSADCQSVLCVNGCWESVSKSYQFFVWQTAAGKERTCPHWRCFSALCVRIKTELNVWISVSHEVRFVFFFAGFTWRKENLLLLFVVFWAFLYLNVLTMNFTLYLQNSSWRKMCKSKIDVRDVWIGLP